MSNTILLKKSGVANAVPGAGNLSLGEVALNYTDGNLFYKDGGGTVNLLVSNKFVSVTGNITGGNLNATGLSLSGNVVSSLNSAANITTTANISGGNIITAGAVSAGSTSASGNVTGANLVTAGNVFASAIIGNTSTFDTRVSLNSVAGIVEITSAGNSTQFTPSGVINLGGASQVKGGTFSGSYLTLGTSQTDLAQDRGGNVTVQVGTGGTIASTWTFAQGGNLLAPGAVSAVGNIIGGNLNATGLSLSGNVVSALVSAANITTTANISANYFIGNGSLLTGIDATSIQNGNSNVKVYANANVATSVNGVANVLLVTDTGVNITGTASANGNVTGGNLITAGAVSAASVSASANITGGNLISNGDISATSATNVQFGANTTLFSGHTTLNANGVYVANTTGTQVIQVTTDGVGNGIVIGTDGTANSSIISTGGIEFAVDGTLVANGLPGAANLIATITNTGLEVVGLISATGNVVAGNITTSGSGGNISGANVISGTTLSATGNITGGNLLAGSGIISTSGNITGGNLNAAGLSLSSNVLSAINSTSNITTTANISGGNVITSGEISAASVSASGNIIAGNIITSGASGNISGANVISGTTFSATGNITGGNVLAGSGIISTSGNITGGNLNAAGLSLSGNVVSALVSAANITTTANISANYYLGNGSQLTGIQASGGTANAIANGSSNVNIATSGGNITAAVGGTANVMVIATTGAYITGEISASGNVTGGNVLAGSGVISTGGNITGGNLLTGGLISSTGNVTGGNLITSAAVSAASVSASANITGGNLITSAAVSAASVSASANVTGGNINTAGLVTTANINSATTLTVTTGAGDINLWPTAGNIHLANTYINHVASPVQPFDAATKQYVDDAVSTGITIHTPVYVESPTALAATYAQGGTTHTVTDITGNATLTFSATHSLNVNDQIYWGSTFNGITANTSYFVYSAPTNTQITLAGIYGGPQLTNLTNGTGLSQVGRANPGVGATLTANVNGAANIDGVLVTSSQRVLIYAQTNAAQNGVYTVTDTGNVSAPWQFTRSSDTNTYQPTSINGLDAGDYFFVQAGDTGAGESYVLTAPVGELILGYDNLTFTQFSASQVYSAGNGLSLNGTVFSVNVDNDTTAIVGGNVVVKASANLVTPNIGAATGSSLSVTGNVTGGNLNAVGLSLSGNVLSPLVSAANITTTGNITGGNIITSGASGNITGANVISGTTLSASGNVIGGNLNAAGLSLSSNVLSAINSTSTITTTANITGGNLNATGLSLSGNVVSPLNVTGNITGGNVNGVTGVYSGGVQVLTINDTVDGGTY